MRILNVLVLLIAAAGAGCSSPATTAPTESTKPLPRRMPPGQDSATRPSPPQP